MSAEWGRRRHKCSPYMAVFEAGEVDKGEDGDQERETVKEIPGPEGEISWKGGERVDEGQGGGRDDGLEPGDVVEILCAVLFPVAVEELLVVGILAGTPGSGRGGVNREIPLPGAGADTGAPGEDADGNGEKWYTDPQQPRMFPFQWVHGGLVLERGAGYGEGAVLSYVQEETYGEEAGDQAAAAVADEGEGYTGDGHELETDH